MKLLVMSDSHGYTEKMRTIINDNRDAECIIFLGDGEHDWDDCMADIPGMNARRQIAVCGNCDPCSFLPVTSFDNIGDHKFYITHGFRQNVKITLDSIYMDALKNERDVVLFGHTHRPFYEEYNGVHLFNPGAVMNGRYGVINIDADGDLSFEHYELA